jgi:hypothetical protein
MKKTAIILTVFMVALGFLAAPAPASWPPVQNITYEVDYQTIWFYAPNNFPNYMGFWELLKVWPKGTRIDDKKVYVGDGVIAWIAYEQHAPSDPVSVTYYVGYAVYDPGRGQWMIDGELLKDQATIGNDFTVKDGMVAFNTEWLVWDDNLGTYVRRQRLHFAIYDPKKGKWQKNYHNFYIKYPEGYGLTNLTVKEGIVAYAWGGSEWQFSPSFSFFYDLLKIAGDFIGIFEGDFLQAFDLAGDVASCIKDAGGGDNRKHVDFWTYDADKGMWCSGLWYDESEGWAFGGIDITAGTVGICKYFGAAQTEWFFRAYDHNKFKWVDTGGTQLFPHACYVAQPTSGTAPLGVWFWDMSNGGNNFFRQWSFSFGENVQTSTERSPYWTFPINGTYEVTQGVYFPDANTPQFSSLRSRYFIFKEPQPGSMEINGGATLTNSSGVSLTQSPGDFKAFQMCLGNGVGEQVLWGPWERYDSSLYNVWWELTTGDGVKYVYVKYRDINNKESAPVSASITLDTTPPLALMAINAGAPYTTSQTITLNLLAGDDSGVAEVRFWEIYPSGLSPLALWEPFVSSGSGYMSKNFTLSPGVGAKTVYAQFKDDAGNISQPISASIDLTTATYLQAGMIINGGALLTNATAVTLNLYAPNGSQMRLGNYDDVSKTTLWGDWEAYQTTKTWNLLPGDGGKQVNGEFRSSNNSVSNAHNFIFLDTTPPVSGSVKWGRGTTSVALKWGGYTDALSGIKSYVLFYNPFRSPKRYLDTKVYEGTEPSFTHQNLTPGKDNYYLLYAVDYAGNWSEGKSFMVTTRPLMRPLPFLSLLLDD